MGNNKQTPFEEADLPDTVRRVGDVLPEVLDTIQARGSGDDEEVRNQALEVAQRRLGVKRIDLEHEFAATEFEVVDTLMEFEATGDPGYGKALEDLKPHHLKMLVEKGDLLPKQK